MEAEEEERTVQGPAVNDGLREQASKGLEALLRTAAEYQELQQLNSGVTRVDSRHVSHISMRSKGYRWDNFEMAEEASLRVADTVFSRVTQNRGKTLIFVAHGASSSYAFRALTGKPVPQGSGGMTALSILRLPSGADVHDTDAWEQLRVNDAQHATDRL